MPHVSTHPLPAPVVPAPALRAALAPGERGRLMILWGWLATMVGIGCYCRATFALPPEAELLDTFTRTGGLGWAAAILMGGGVLMWLTGNLRYLREAMDAPAPGRDGGGSRPQS